MLIPVIPIRIAFAGGGSIGHLAPLVAVWRAIEKSPNPGSHVRHADEPDDVGRTPAPDDTMKELFFCSDRPGDAEYLRHEGIACTQLPSIHRDLWMPWAVLRSYKTAYAVLRKQRPAVLLSKGGGITIPVCLAARRLGIPIVVHESDSVPGRATRFLSHWAKAVCYGFPAVADNGSTVQWTMEHTEPLSTGALSTVHFTGNPLRPDITKGSRTKGLAITGLSGKRPVLLVLGGSQGAQALNEAVIRNIDALLQFCDIAHITGPEKAGAEKRPGYWSTPIVYEDFPDILAIGSLAVSRAGAGTIAELAACSIPTVLVPLRGVARDHQEHNTRLLTDVGVCVCLDQATIDENLVLTVRQCLEDHVKTKKSANRLHSLHTPSASGQIAKVMLSCIATAQRPA